MVHFHPSVSLFATRLLYGNAMPTKPDLASHTLIHFLDRFVYRNAKVAASSLRGNSIMQPLGGSESRGILLSHHLSHHRYESLNSESFWRKKIDDVAVDEVFFHKYFNHVGKRAKAARQETKHSHDVRDVSDDDDDEDEDFIWRTLTKAQPEVEDYHEGDSDVELLNLDDSEDGSSFGVGMDVEEANDLGDSGSEGFDINALQEIEGDEPYHDNEDDSANIDGLPRDDLNKRSPVGKAMEESKSSRSKRRKIKNFPIFASTEEYAGMLEDDDNID